MIGSVIIFRYKLNDAERFLQIDYTVAEQLS